MAKVIRDSSGKVTGGEGDQAKTYVDPNSTKINPGGLGDLAKKMRKTPPPISPTPTPRPVMAKKSLGGSK